MKFQAYFKKEQNKNKELSGQLTEEGELHW